ncbi:hypothetical protein RB195_008133 [Necator americanus]|uniref:26S proteasome non-ATPase regulatory subunit 1/RPN2 N-terminal domain-containing protein n=1 Tax=Necator americanus TaxID=51031 RepID=A0ABR1CM64_NECAM
MQFIISNWKSRVGGPVDASAFLKSLRSSRSPAKEKEVLIDLFDDWDVLTNTWFEVADCASFSEELAEDKSFPARQKAVLLASKVAFCLEDYENALNFALAADTHFKLTPRPKSKTVGGKRMMSDSTNLLNWEVKVQLWGSRTLTPAMRSATYTSRTFCPFKSLVYSSLSSASQVTSAHPNRDNLDWISKATNWNKFNAVATLGLIHKGHESAAMKLLEPYLPKSEADQFGFKEGGSLFALAATRDLRIPRMVAAAADNCPNENQMMAAALHDNMKPSELARLCKETVKEDLKERRADVLAEAAEEGKSIRYAREDFASRKTKMTALRNPKGTTIESKRGMEKIINDFYSDLWQGSLHIACRNATFLNSGRAARPCCCIKREIHMTSATIAQSAYCPSSTSSLEE